MDWKSAYFKRTLMCTYDIIAVNLAFVLALVSGTEGFNSQVLLERALPVTIIFEIIFAAFRLYSSMWEYAGIRELFGIACAGMLGGLSSIAVDVIMSNFGFAANELPNGCFSANFYVFGTMLVIAFVGGMRLMYRIIRRIIRERGLSYKNRSDRVMIIGAGNMGMIVISELEAGGFAKGKPVVAVDDNPNKIGKRIRGVPVKGDVSQIERLAEKYKVDTIILCIPTASNERQTEILHIAVKTGCKLKTSPSLTEFRENNEDLRIRDINISDLLERPEVSLDRNVCKYVTNQTVLITGGGGSIGSELCRQVSKYNPERIVIFDIYENNAYLLKMQFASLEEESPKIDIRIGSVRDKARLEEVFEEFHPTIVFHAAAHKHVPLMEDSPKEAIKNNIFGTYNLAETAVKYRVSHFVSISTDKAVNPANVMGATKRVTEMIVQYFGRKCRNSTIFAAVRFGNVLGSSGSVIPIFTDQIANGGPVTVTDPEITRYFMTIPEAAQLVVQAGGLAKGGEVFILDMGEPVKILSLAENLIRLSGYKPYTEIEIKFSGLRPGEKLYEELVLDEESGERKITANNKIFVTKPLEMDDKLFEQQLEELKSADVGEIRDLLKQIVPNFKEQS